MEEQRWLTTFRFAVEIELSGFSDTPMDCQALGAPRVMGQEKPDLASSATMAVNQRWPRRGTHHHLH